MSCSHVKPINHKFCIINLSIFLLTFENPFPWILLAIFLPHFTAFFPLFSIYPRWGSLSLSQEPLMLTKLFPYFSNIPGHLLDSHPPSFMIETLDLSTIFWKIYGNYLPIWSCIHNFSTLNLQQNYSYKLYLKSCVPHPVYL